MQRPPGFDRRTRARTSRGRRSATRTATAGSSRRSRPGSPAGNGRTDDGRRRRWPTCCTRRPSVTARSRRSPRRTTGGTGTRRTWTPARAGAPRTRPPRPPTATWRRSSRSWRSHEHHRRQPFQQRPGFGRVVAVLDAFQRRPSQPRLLPGDVRPPSDQHDHRDDRRGARRARRPDRAGPGPQRRRLRQRQPRFLPGPLRRGERPGQDRGAGRRSDRAARVDRSPRPPVACAGGQHRLDPRTRPRRRKRVRAGLRPAVRLAREHAARPVRGRHRRGPRRRSDGPALPLGRPRPRARDPPRRRRSRRTARGAVRVRQPADRRRPARRRGRRRSPHDSRASTTTRSRARSPTSTR